MQKQIGNSSCGSCIALVMFLGLVYILGYVLVNVGTGILKFFTEPGLLYRLVGMVIGIPICIGIILVFIFLLSKIPVSWAKGDHQGGGEGDDDYYFHT